MPMKYRIYAILILIIGGLLGWGLYTGQVNPQGNNWFSRHPYRLGLDLAGGTELVYKAKTDDVKTQNIDEAMSALRDTIERRVNLFGVGEPSVQVETTSIVSGTVENRLIVELPGVTDVNEAVKQIGKTPILEFRLPVDNAEEIAKNNPKATADELFQPAILTGQYLDSARVEFPSSSNVANAQPYIGLQFNSEGADIFRQLTSENVGKQLAIFLDGEIISSPVINEEISEGQAQITGSFTIDEAKTLVRDLNYGALPVPIELVGTQTVGAYLGSNALNLGLKAGIIGLGAVVLFLILLYRIPGLIASIALSTYIIVSLLMFKLFSITITAAGLAGFILSVGMAVDANILIFERYKEELKRGKDMLEAMKEGFDRAWTSIRDSNISSIITAIILFWLGTSSVKGFALTLGIGVIVSMLSAVVISRTFLFAVMPKSESRLVKFLFSKK